MAPLRPLIRLRLSPIKRTYSTASEPLIGVYNLPAKTGHVRVLSLNRPSARNALSRQLLAELQANVRSIAAQYDSEGNELPAQKNFGGAAGEDKKGACRVLVLASALDNSFCAGADLKEREGFGSDETASYLHDLRSTFTEISALPIPSISAISSIALGGGLELGLATTFRVLSSNALIGLPETRLGILPGAGGTYRLPQLIGLSRARDLILTGRRVTGPEAYFLGIADRLVDVSEESDEVDKEAVLKEAREKVLVESMRMALEITEGAPVSIRQALMAIGHGEAAENAAYDVVVKTEDRNEALQAFKEKRKPVWKGSRSDDELLRFQ